MTFRLTVSTMLLGAFAASAACGGEAGAGATYRVSAQGDDAAAGTETAPWKTAAKAAAAAKAGDTVIFTAGEYDGPLAPANCGSKDAPIVFKAAEGAKVTIRKPKDAQDEAPDAACIRVRKDAGSWTHFAGFVLHGGSNDRHFNGGKGVLLDGAEGVTIENCEITRTRWGVSGIAGDRVALRRLKIHDNRFGVTLGAKGGTGVTNVTIEDCEAYDHGDTKGKINSDGILVENGCTGLAVRRCRAWNNPDSGFDLKPEGTVVDSCVAYRNGGQGFKLWGKQDVVVNCVSYDNGWAGFLGGGATRFVHCVAVGNKKIGWRTSGTALFRNCIVANNDICFDTREGPAKPDIAFTLFWKCGERKEGNDAYTFEKGRNCVVDKDPMFADPAKGDFHLKDGSPAVDAGTAEVPDPPKLDLDGKPRAQGKAPDIGAFER